MSKMSMSVGKKGIRTRATLNARRNPMTLGGSGLVLPEDTMAMANPATARATTAMRCHIRYGPTP